MVCVCVCACVRACVCVYVCMCKYACSCVGLILYFMCTGSSALVLLCIGSIYCIIIVNTELFPAVSICRYVHKPFKFFKELGIAGPKPQAILGNITMFSKFEVCIIELLSLLLCS